MNRALVTELALRLLAVYSWVQAFWDVSRGIAFWSSFRAATAGLDPIVAVFMSAVAYVACGIVLFMWARPWSRRMFPIDADAPLKHHTEIGGLALRILGIVLLTWAVEAVPSLLAAVHIGNSLGALVYSATLLLLLVMGTWLFVRGNKVAVWLLRTTPAAGDGSMAWLQAMAVAVAGLVVFATGLPDAFGVLIVWIGKRLGDENQPMMAARYEWPASIAPIARIVLGLSLFVGSSGIAFLWHKARTAGLTTSTPRPDRDRA